MCKSVASYKKFLILLTVKVFILKKNNTLTHGWTKTLVLVILVVHASSHASHIFYSLSYL